ncbi:MAG: hypothetical protein KAW17_00440 [Candidatus Eisenbacteria sp.]|nr:hypothetical protein [Candidatus Eisenbacteria bacterium]
MRYRRGPISMMILFPPFAMMFALVFWPEVSCAAKIGFFAAGAGFGVGLGRFRAQKSSP